MKYSVKSISNTALIRFCTCIQDARPTYPDPLSRCSRKIFSQSQMFPPPIKQEFEHISALIACRASPNLRKLFFDLSIIACNFCLPVWLFGGGPWLLPIHEDNVYPVSRVSPSPWNELCLTVHKILQGPSFRLRVTVQRKCSYPLYGFRCGYSQLVRFAIYCRSSSRKSLDFAVSLTEFHYSKYFLYMVCFNNSSSDHVGIQSHICEASWGAI